MKSINNNEFSVMHQDLLNGEETIVEKFFNSGEFKLNDAILLRAKDLYFIERISRGDSSINFENELKIRGIEPHDFEMSSFDIIPNDVELIDYANFKIQDAEASIETVINLPGGATESARALRINDMKHRIAYWKNVIEIVNGKSNRRLKE